MQNEKKLTPRFGTLTIDEQLAAFINGLIDKKIEVVMDNISPRFVTRSQAMKEIGRKAYEEGIRTGLLTPIANAGRNAKIRIRRREYEMYIDSLALHQ